MEHTATYLAIRDMIQHGLFSMIFPDLPHTLSLLEQRGLITKTEHEHLMTLAEETYHETLLNWWETILADPTPALPSN
jgi:hypothetical protein